MAMTEQSEKAERQQLMDTHQVSEFEAAKMVGEKLKPLFKNARK